MAIRFLLNTRLQFEQKHLIFLSKTKNPLKSLIILSEIYNLMICFIQKHNNSKLTREFEAII